MIPRRFFLLILAWLLAQGRVSVSRPAKRGRFIGAGSEVYASGKMVANISAFLTAGDFFEGMERSTVNGLDQYRKEGRRVEAYPTEILVVVLIVPLRRDQDVPQWSKLMPDPEFGRNFAASLKFDLRWKRGFEMRSADRLSLEFRKGSSVEGLSLVSGPNAMHLDANEWAWEMRVASKDVPLTDHLVITINARDGSRLTRLSAVL